MLNIDTKNGTMSRKGTKESKNQKNDRKKTMARPNIEKKENETFDKVLSSLYDRKSTFGDGNSVGEEDLYKVLDLYYYQDFYMYRHLQNDYDKFIDDSVMRFFREVNHVFAELIEDDKIHRHKFTFSNLRVSPPKHSNNVDPFFPSDARHLSQTYSLTIYGDIQQVKETVFLNLNGSDRIKTKKVGHAEIGVPIMHVPVMVRSKYCSTSIYKDEVRGECRYDPGGHFIVGGNEKVIILQDRMIDNHPMVFMKKVSNISYFVAQVNSRPKNINDMTQTINIKMKKDNAMVIKIPILSEVNVMILFRAMGIESDTDIVECCTYDHTDRHMTELVRFSLDACYDDMADDHRKITTQEEAIDYLITKMRVMRRYNESSHHTKMEQRKMHLVELLKNTMFPHIEGNLLEKAYYMGYVVNKLLRTVIGRIPIDDRDSYTRKRVDGIDSLLMEIFKQHYKNNMTECNKQFISRQEDNLDSDTPYTVVHLFRPNIFEQGFKAALTMGNWPRRVGVSQMLQRLSYMLLLSFMSRVDSQSGGKSSSKLTKPRLMSASSVGFLCPNQTPEHSKVGLTKHMSIISSITIGDNDNYELVREWIITNKDFMRIYDVPMNLVKNMYKIFLNGEWMGLIQNTNKIGGNPLDNPVMRMYLEGRTWKLTGLFNPQSTSVVLDNREQELRFYTDSGRFYRPVLRVNGDNELVLTKAMTGQISLEKTNKNHMTSWPQFYSHDECPIEFMCSEEQPYRMISYDVDNLKDRRIALQSTIGFKFDGKEAEILNRYDDKYFVRYDCCEIHPSVLVGGIIANMPFCNTNQGPRLMFQYAQGKQAMGIYNTAYRSRTDISYILYHPQCPLVNTRTAKYTYGDILPSGENVMVAIACYSGYNQEDSLIFNRTSLERGMFRTMSLKKYNSTITKNQETSGDDRFMKPPPDKTIGIKLEKYEKLNDDAYVTPETKIFNGDVIFGKVTPINTMGDSQMIYKDSSEQYKNHAPGVVDRIYLGIKNQDGYDSRKASVRSERIPGIGDKFCSRFGQKGTLGIAMDSMDMPYNKYGVRPDIIMNPNAIPSRMTVGQLFECITGKIGAIKGCNVDGTPFRKIDLEKIKDDLESLGYHRDGVEYLYNGMTGKKIKSMIFFGPTFYQRLKHMTADKIHSRARGPITALTRQAPEGRMREGGLRMGEMERDVVIAHGMAKFLKERLMDCSDPYTTYVCGKCGLFARREESRYNKPSPSPTDIWYCPPCENYNDVHKIMIPYAFKLMVQELLSMCIAPRIRVQKNIAV